MRCWAADIRGELSSEEALAVPEPSPGTARDEAGMRVVRGGAWGYTMQCCRSGSRHRNLTMYRLTGSGVRVANLRLEVLRHLVRLAHELGALSTRRWEYAAREIDDLGRQVGGWQRASTSPS